MMNKISQVLNLEKILIIVPHQDDELSLVGPLIPLLKNKGFYVEVLFTTNGDYDSEQVARFKESEKVKKILGIDNSSYLGYADSGPNVCDNNIYNFNSVFVSNSGRNKTCGVLEKDEYCFKKNGVHRELTRINMLNDLKEFILDFHPFAIFCVDYDNHPDHKITSLLVDEAMGQIKNLLNPLPLYFKSFCYLGQWYGRNDYFAKIPQPTFCEISNKPVIPGPYLEEDKISISVDPKFYNPLFWKSPLYKCYKTYASQKAKFKFFRCLNSDQIFWFRDLSCVSYKVARSKNAEYLQDGKLLDSSNVRIKFENEPFVGWAPTRLNNKIEIILDKPATNIKCFIYTNNFQKKPLNILVKTNFGEHRFDNSNSVIKIYFSEKYIKHFTIYFEDPNFPNFYVNEIEIFNNDLQLKKCNEFISDFNSFNTKKRSCFKLLFGKLIYHLNFLFFK